MISPCAGPRDKECRLYMMTVHPEDKPKAGVTALNGDQDSRDDGSAPVSWSNEEDETQGRPQAADVAFPAVTKRQQKIKKRHDKRKARAHKDVDALADRLTNVAGPVAKTVKAVTRAQDDDMNAVKAPAAPREDLKKKLRAKLAGHALDRTQGLEKGLADHGGLKKRTPGSRREMDES
ncbi:unnamed protein product [Effrenium voratum]|nr:unnamed protein product [Effrenium voratum]